MDRQSIRFWQIEFDNISGALSEMCGSMRRSQSSAFSSMLCRRCAGAEPQRDALTRSV